MFFPELTDKCKQIKIRIRFLEKKVYKKNIFWYNGCQTLGLKVSYSNVIMLY